MGYHWWKRKKMARKKQGIWVWGNGAGRNVRRAQSLFWSIVLLLRD